MDRGEAAAVTQASAAAGTSGGTGGYSPPTLVDLAGWLADEADEPVRRRLVLEFLECWRWEPRGERLALLVDEPPPTGDERYDVLLAALAEHLAAQDGSRGPGWAHTRSLTTWWFPDDSPAARADALVRAPAALRRRGVFIAADDLARV